MPHGLPQQLRQLSDVSGDAPGLVLGEQLGRRAPTGKLTSSRVRRGQRHQLVRRLRRLRDERAAVAVGCGDETRSHAVAEKRDSRDVGSLLNRQDAAGVAAVLGITERVWTPKGTPGRSMLSCAPKSATLPVKVEGVSSHSVPVGPANVTWPESGTLTAYGPACEALAVSSDQLSEANWAKRTSRPSAVCASISDISDALPWADSSRQYESRLVAALKGSAIPG